MPLAISLKESMLAPGIRRDGNLFQPPDAFTPEVMLGMLGAVGASDGTTTLEARTLTLPAEGVVRGTVETSSLEEGAPPFLPKFGRSMLISGTLGRLTLGSFGSFTCRAVGARASWPEAVSDTAHSKAPVVAGPAAAVKAGESMAWRSRVWCNSDSEKMKGWWGTEVVAT